VVRRRDEIGNGESNGETSKRVIQADDSGLRMSIVRVSNSNGPYARASNESSTTFCRGQYTHSNKSK
jgi:hypothetical protein